MPPETTPPITPPSPEPYKFNFWETDPKRNFAPWFLKFCLVLITLGIILTGFLKYQAYQSYKTSLSLVATSTDEFAGWQTYRNEEYGFEFKYPGDGLPEENNTDTYVRIQNYSLNKKTTTGLNAGEYYMELSLLNDSPEYSCATAFPGAIQAVSSRSTIYTSKNPLDTEGGESGGRRFGLCTEKSGKIIYLYVTQNAFEGSLASKILSTFKFIPSTSLGKSEPIPTDWRTYRNEEVGFEVKYPAEWGPTWSFGEESKKADFAMDDHNGNQFSIGFNSFADMGDLSAVEHVTGNYVIMGMKKFKVTVPEVFSPGKILVESTFCEGDCAGFINTWPPYETYNQISLSMLCDKAKSNIEKCNELFDKIASGVRFTK